MQQRRQLEVILGVVAGLVLELAEQLPGFLQLAAQAVDAGPLQLDLAAGVAGLLGLVEGLEGLVQVLLLEQGLAEVEVGQGAFGLLQVLDRRRSGGRGRSWRCRA